MDIDINISKRFADIRHETKLSKKDFAKTLGVHPVVSGDIELGKREPSRHILITLAKVYGTDLNWLLTGETNKQAKRLTETA